MKIYRERQRYRDKKRKREREIRLPNSAGDQRILRKACAHSPVASDAPGKLSSRRGPGEPLSHTSVFRAPIFGRPEPSSPQGKRQILEPVAVQHACGNQHLIRGRLDDLICLVHSSRSSLVSCRRVSITEKTTTTKSTILHQS